MDKTIDLEITSFQPSDLETVIQFLRDAFRAIGFDFDRNTKDKDLRDIASEYQSNDGVFLLAKRRGELIGTIALRQISDDTCELKRFYVKVEHQRKGVGTSLLKKVIDHAKSGRWSRIRLDTTRQSPAAISLFRRHGFVEIEKYNDNPDAQIYMELRTS